MDEKLSKKNMYLQGSILALAGIVTKLIGFIYRIPMANMLGSEGNGIYSVAFGIYNVVLTLSSYSLPLVISKLVSTRLAKKQYKSAFRLFRYAIVFAVLIGTIGAVLLFFGSDFIEQIYGTPGLHRSLKIMAPTVLVVAILGVFRGFFQGRGSMVPTAVSQIMEQIVNAIISIVAIWIFVHTYAGASDVASYGAAGGTVGTLAGALMALVVIVLIFLAYRPKIKIQTQNDTNTQRDSGRSIYKLIWITMLPIIFSQTIYQIGYTLDDLIFSNIMNFKGMDQLVRKALQGVFNSQYTLLINVPIAVATAMAVSIIPSIVSSDVQGKVEEVEQKVSTVIRFVMVIAFPSAFGFTALAKPLMTLLFPQLETYNHIAVNLLLFGSLAIVFYSLSTITSAILQGLDYMKVPVFHSAISLVIHIVLVLGLLVSTNLGVYVLLIGDMTFPLVISILNWRSIKINLGAAPQIKSTFSIPCICSAVMGILTFVTYQLLKLFVKNNLVATLFAVVVAVLTYVFLILLLHCFTEDELYSFPFGGRLVKIERKIGRLRRHQ